MFDIVTTESELAEKEECSGAKRPFYQPGWYPDLSNDEYHGSFGYGSTTLKILTEKTMAHLNYMRLQPNETTSAMMIGQAVHTLAMEPHKFESEFIVRPEGLKKPTVSQLNAAKPTAKTQAQISAWNNYQESVIGKMEIKEEELDKAKAMTQKLKAHPLTGSILSDGICEQSLYYWYNPEDWDERNDYRMMLKVRPDWIVPGHPVLFDLKTSKDASYSPFMRDIKKLKYHVSAAMYLDGVNRNKAFLESCGVFAFTQFVWIVVENFEPFEVAVYEISKDDLEEGKNIYHSLVRKLDLYNRSEWKGYGEQVGSGIDPCARMSELPRFGNQIV